MKKTPGSDIIFFFYLLHPRISGVTLNSSLLLSLKGWGVKHNGEVLLV